MATEPVLPETDGDRVAHGVREALEKLNNAGGEVILDFSSVRRIDPKAVSALEQLAHMADDKSVKVAVRGVNVGVYKVLKLMKLASRFSFQT